jgi:hypothetical protein
MSSWDLRHRPANGEDTKTKGDVKLETDDALEGSASISLIEYLASEMEGDLMRKFWCWRSRGSRSDGCSSDGAGFSSSAPSIVSVLQ